MVHHPIVRTWKSILLALVFAAALAVAPALASHHTKACESKCKQAEMVCEKKCATSTDPEACKKVCENDHRDCVEDCRMD